MKKADLMYVLVLSLVAAAGAVAHENPDQALTPEDVRLNLESFDYVWSTINDKHFDTTFGGLDWKAVRDELRPKVEAATTMREAREHISTMIARLGLSHFAIMPVDLYSSLDRPARKGDHGGSRGFKICIIDNKAFVAEVREGGPAAGAGIMPGWEITLVDNEEVESLFVPLIEEFQNSSRLEFYLMTSVASRLQGAIGDTVTILFRDGDGDPVEKRLELGEPHGKKIVFGNFPPFYLATKVETLEDGIGYIHFSHFFDPAELMAVFGDAMESFKDAPGIVIDVRGNPGGIGMMAVGMANWLTREKDLYLGTFATRAAELKFVVNPRAQTYSGPVAVLIDGGSGSTSEIFCQGLQDIGRARLFGNRTAGAALPSMIERLPNGDGFQYAFANYVSASGKVLEGMGVMPDVEVRHTREALLEGKDLVLEAAVRWIRNNAE